MKSLLRIILVLLIIHSTVTQAQKGNQKVEVKAQQNTYVYEGSKTNPKSLLGIYRKNSIPSYYLSKDYKIKPLEHYLYTTEKPISKSVYEVFSTKDLKN